MSSADCPSHDELLDFVLGRTDGDCADRIASHALGCSHCQQTLDRIDSSTDDLLNALRQPLDDPSDDASCRRMLERSVACIRDESRSSLTDVLPHTLRDYQLLEPIGHGGMGNVYRAIHRRLKRIVAVKVIANHRLQNPTMLERFSREMETVGQLDHPRIVRALDAGDVDGVHYLVMELLEGLDSQQLVQRVGPLPVAAACVLLSQAVDGLHYAHQRGLVHRDIKPSNLFVTTDGQLRILDFGLARLMDGSFQNETPEIAGSLDYMPPEQLRGETLDHRADIYALGVTLYYWLTQEWPGSANDDRSILELSRRRWTEPVIPIRQRRADIPAELEAILQKMLAADVSQRLVDLPAIRAVASSFMHHADLHPLLVRAGLNTPAHSQTDTSIDIPSHVPASASRLRPTRYGWRASGLFVVSAILLAVVSWKAIHWDASVSSLPSSLAPTNENRTSIRSTMNGAVVERECFQVRLETNDDELFLSSSPGEGVWVRQRNQSTNDPPYFARAWDLLELKIQEPRAFQLYQQNWPAHFGQSPLPTQLPPSDQNQTAQQGIKWRHVSWPQGLRRVETLTPQDHVVARESLENQEVILEFLTPSTATANRRVALRRDANDETSRKLLNDFWTAWPDEQSN